MSIAYTSKSDGDYVLLENSIGGSTRASSTAVALNFLLDGPESLRVVWSLDQFTAPILRLFPLPVCKKLVSNNRAFFRPYSILYNSSKTFTIRLGRRSVTIYGIDQYWPDDEPDPVDVGQLTERIKSLLFILDSALGIVPNRLSSPVAVYDDFVFRHLNLPSVLDVPESAIECLQYALRCTNRQWVSNYQIGHWGSGECWDFDVSGAYPSEAARLVDFRGAKFVKSRLYIPGAVYGFLRGRVTITHPVSPIMVEVNGRNQVNPIGSKDTFLTIDEVEFIHQHHIGDFKLRDGWFICGCSNVKPLKSIMEGLYSRRGRDPLSDRFIKRAANGIIGKLLETRQGGAELGDRYNPIWHALVTSRVRLRDAEFLYSHNATNSLIHLGTDGCLLDRPVFPLPGDNWGNGMGSWRFTGSESTFVLSPGLLFTGPRHPKGIHYNLLRSMIAKHPMSSEYRAVLPRHVTLAEAARSGNVSSVGELRDFYSTVDLNTLHLNQDRVYKKLPKTGTALLNNKYRSSPIEL